MSKISQVDAKKLVCYTTLLLNAQVLIGTAGNPIGIDGFQEAFYVCLVTWAFCDLWRQQAIQGGVRRLDFLVVLITVLPMIYGALAALSIYGQPLPFGILEERRILAVLIYFPIRTFLDHEWIKVDHLHRYLISVGVVCSLLSIGVLIDVVPAINEVRSSNVALRGERISVGGPWIALTIPFLLSYHASKSSRMKIFLVALLVGTLVIVIQSRQLLAASLISALFVLRGPRSALVVVLLVISAYLSALYVPEIQDRFTVIFRLFADATSQEYLTESWRGQGYAIVINAISLKEFAGHGSLSHHWNNGFDDVIGTFFFLADIGIVGTIFRYGIFGTFVYFFWASTQWALLMKIEDRGLRVLYSSLFLFLLVGLPVAAPLEYRGNMTGLILGITGFLASKKFNERQT